ncbi:hypothetical protein MRB53_037499 [Persea americana]|nr:hypothetical protein MRB53_037499 [Persea americana]
MSPGVTTSLKPYPSATSLHFSPTPPTTSTVFSVSAISRIGVWPQMNCPGDTSISSCLDSWMQRSASVLPPPLVTKMYGLASDQRYVTISWTYSHLDAVVVLPVEHLHGLDRLGDGLAASDQDAVNVECECVLVRHARDARLLVAIDLETRQVVPGKLEAGRGLVRIAGLVDLVRRNNDCWTEGKLLLRGVVRAQSSGRSVAEASALAVWRTSC